VKVGPACGRYWLHVQVPVQEPLPAAQAVQPRPIRGRRSGWRRRTRPGPATGRVDGRWSRSCRRTGPHLEPSAAVGDRAYVDVPTGRVGAVPGGRLDSRTLRSSSTYTRSRRVVSGRVGQGVRRVAGSRGGLPDEASASSARRGRVGRGGLSPVTAADKRKPAGQAVAAMPSWRPEGLECALPEDCAAESRIACAPASAHPGTLGRCTYGQGRGGRREADDIRRMSSLLV
jgi:hypothetical protein